MAARPKDEICGDVFDLLLRCAPSIHGVAAQQERSPRFRYSVLSVGCCVSVMLLLSLSDFAEFKDLMLEHKREKVGSKMCVCVGGVGQR